MTIFFSEKLLNIKFVVISIFQGTCSPWNRIRFDIPREDVIKQPTSYTTTFAGVYGLVRDQDIHPWFHETDTTRYHTVCLWKLQSIMKRFNLQLELLNMLEETTKDRESIRRLSCNRKRIYDVNSRRVAEFDKESSSNDVHIYQDRRLIREYDYDNRRNDGYRRESVRNSSELYTESTQSPLDVNTSTKLRLSSH